MKKQNIVAIAIMLASAFSLQARPKPSWMTELPLPGNNTYIYVKETGLDSTAQGALNWALVHVFENTANRIGKPFDSKRAFALLYGGATYEDVAEEYGVPINLVDHYTDKQSNGTYLVYVLCQVIAIKDVPPIWDRGKNIDKNYNWTCLYRSIVPGVGQMTKGYTGEGVVTLVADALLVGGAVGCYFMAQDQLGTIRATTPGNPSYNEAVSKYKSLQATQYVLWGAAGAVYVFNFVRAFTLQPKSTANFVFSPSVMSTPYVTSPTVGLAFNF